MKGLLKTIALVWLSRWERVPIYTTIAERDTYAPTRYAKCAPQVAKVGYEKKDYVYNPIDKAFKASKSRCMLLQ